MTVFKKNNQYIIKDVKGSSVILNAQTGDYFGLKNVGTEFIKLVDGKRELDQIIAELLKIYDVEEATLRQDIQELAGSMAQKGILIADER